MSRRRKIITLLASGVFFVVAVFFLRREREPSYQGRSLTEWMTVYEVSSSPAESDEATHAIRQIGTNAIPHLLKWIQYEPNFSRRGLIPRINGAIEWVNDKVNATSFVIIHDRDFDRAYAAPKAFGCLGNIASSAVPELARLLNNPEDHWISSDNAGEALARMGATGLPTLVATLKDTKSLATLIVLENIPHLETNALPIVPLLIQIVQSDTETESSAAATALGELALEPGTVIPPLIVALTSSQPATIQASVKALGQYGAHARPAIPALTNLLISSSETLRQATTNTLNAIDPIVFTNKVPMPVRHP